MVEICFDKQTPICYNLIKEVLKKERKMSFIQNITRKKEFKQKLDSTQFIFKEAMECFSPANNVYWHFNLRAHHEDLNVTKKDICLSITTLSNYINQIKNLNEFINKQYESNTKLFEKYSKNVIHSNSYINQINKYVSTLMDNLKKIPEYKDTDILKYLYKQLNNIHNELFPLVKNSSQQVETTALA